MSYKPTMQVDLSGKVILVTGAAQGIGRHFSLLLAKEGATVVVTSLKSDIDKLNDLVSEINEIGGKAISLDVDLTDFNSFDEKIAHIVSQTNKIDVLINNAGISYYTKFFDIDEKDWDAHMDANLKGVFFLSQSVAKNMVKQKISGSIINIGSIAGNQTKKYHLPFCVSKAGMHHLTKLIAFELVDYGIRVNGISPGLFPSEHVVDYIASEAGKIFIEQIPMKRPGKYRELDGALLMLSSDASTYMTGSIIDVDGGFSIDIFLRENFEDESKKLNPFFKTAKNTNID